MKLLNSEVTKKRDELKRDLNTQTAYTISSIINEKVLLYNQNTMIGQDPVIREEVDHRPGRLSRTAEEKRARNTWNTNSKPILVNSSRHGYFSQNSDVSESSDEDHDIRFIQFRWPEKIILCSVLLIVYIRWVRFTVFVIVCFDILFVSKFVCNISNSN